jgi:acetylornithine/N-succinyldiaminopimelate aminotransferase
VADTAADVITRARDAGLLVVSAGEHTVRLLPPLVATRDELAEGLKRLELALG